MAHWTENQIKDHITDQIIKIIMQNRHEPYFYNENFQLDLDFYRKTVGNSGQIETGELEEDDIDIKKNVIYQEDYQKQNNQCITTNRK